MSTQQIEIISQGQGLQTQLSSKLLQLVVKEGSQERKLSGYSSSVIESVALGYCSQIRKLAEDVQEELVSLAIRQMSESYGSRKEIDDQVLSECIDLVIENFGKIGATEIRTAYQLWSMRIINGMEMWGGEFNAAQLGRVLSDYVRYRQKVVNTLINERERIEKEARTEEEIRKRNEAVVRDFPKAIEKAQEKCRTEEGFLAWQKVPGHWYKLAERHEMISMEYDDKKPYWERAKNIAKKEIDSEVNGLMASNRHIQARSHRGDYREGGEMFARRAAVIAQKIIVHELLIQPCQPKPT